MSPSDNAFTDNLSAVDRIYKGRAGLDEKVDHIDGEEDTSGEPIDLAARDAVPSSRGGEITAAEQVALGETPPDEPADQLSGVDANPDADPDELSEEELEAATRPEGEEE
jgi:hypothetical protein